MREIVPVANKIFLESLDLFRCPEMADLKNDRVEIATVTCCRHSLAYDRHWSTSILRCFGKVAMFDFFIKDVGYNVAPIMTSIGETKLSWQCLKMVDLSRCPRSYSGRSRCIVSLCHVTSQVSYPTVSAGFSVRSSVAKLWQ